MSGESPNEINLTKLDVAKRQVETAINLWAAEGDPVAVHTLTAAGHRVLMDLSKHRGLKPPFLFDVGQFKQVTEKEEKEYKKHLRRAETFFKHANTDPEDTLKFDPEFTEAYLWSACQMYKNIIGKATQLMDAFSAYHMLNMEFLRSHAPEMAENLSKINLGSLSRRDQLDIFAYALARREGK